MELHLTGKTALVTGGTHGIGRAISLSLARENVKVAFLSRSEEKLAEQEKLHQKINSDFLSIKCDVLDSNSIK